MSAHKNECRGGARQVVKSISKRAADFTATAACAGLLLMQDVLTATGAVLLLEAALNAMGVLQ